MSNIKEELKNILGKDLTEKVKAFLKLNATPVSIEVKLDDIPLTDGTVLTVDKKEVGGIATITTADGTAPAPDGDYSDVDGNIYTIVGGAITVITPKAEEPVVAGDSSMSAIAELKSLVAKLEKQSNEKLTNLIKENKSLKVELESQKNGLQIALSAIDKIAETPVTTALEFQTVNKTVKKYEDMNSHEKYLFDKYGKI